MFDLSISKSKTNPFQLPMYNINLICPRQINTDNNLRIVGTQNGPKSTGNATDVFPLDFIMSRAGSVIRVRKLLD